MESQVSLHVEGCSKILERAILLYYIRYEPDMRAALILTDNAVEIALQSYIAYELGKKPPFNSFHQTLDLTQQNNPDVAALSKHIKYIHNLRNGLYHGESSLSTRQDVVLKALLIAFELFGALYGPDFEELLSNNPRLNFLLRFAQLEEQLRVFCRNNSWPFESVESFTNRVSSYSSGKLDLQLWMDIVDFLRHLVPCAQPTTRSEFDEALRQIDGLSAKIEIPTDSSSFRESVLKELHTDVTGEEIGEVGKQIYGQIMEKYGIEFGSFLIEESLRIGHRLKESS